MKQITLKIPDDRYKFFLELVQSLDFVRVTEKLESEGSQYEPEFVESILQGEKDIAAGKGIKMSIDEFRSLSK